MPEPLTPEEVAVLVHTINEQRAEIARLRSQQSLLDVLREIAIDPSIPPHLRLKAAEAGVSFETPKLSASANAISTYGGPGAKLDKETQKNKELEARGWTHDNWKREVLEKDRPRREARQAAYLQLVERPPDDAA